MIPPWLIGPAAKLIGGAVIIAVITSLGVIVLKKIEDAGRLEAELESQRVQSLTLLATIEQQNASRERFNQQLENLRADRLKARQELERINELFARHDLEKLAKAKPDTVSRLLTAGHARINCLLERASGADRGQCPGETGTTSP